MYQVDPFLREATKISRRRHRIRLLVPTQPDNREEYHSFCVARAKDFAHRHNAKLVALLDVDPLPFREGAIITFEVKEFKHPEKHPYVFNAAGEKVRPRKAAQGNGPKRA